MVPWRREEKRRKEPVHSRHQIMSFSIATSLCQDQQDRHHRRPKCRSTSTRTLHHNHHRATFSNPHTHPRQRHARTHRQEYSISRSGSTCSRQISVGITNCSGATRSLVLLDLPYSAARVQGPGRPDLNFDKDLHQPRLESVPCSTLRKVGHCCPCSSGNGRVAHFRNLGEC